MIRNSMADKCMTPSKCYLEFSDIGGSICSLVAPRVPSKGSVTRISTCKLIRYWWYQRMGGLLLHLSSPLYSHPFGIFIAVLQEYRLGRYILVVPMYGTVWAGCCSICRLHSIAIVASSGFIIVVFAIDDISYVVPTKVYPLITYI